jgi:hypothetical protein
MILFENADKSPVTFDELDAEKKWHKSTGLIKNGTLDWMWGDS